MDARLLTGGAALALLAAMLPAAARESCVDTAQSIPGSLTVTVSCQKEGESNDEGNSAPSGTPGEDNQNNADWNPICVEGATVPQCDETSGCPPGTYPNLIQVLVGLEWQVQGGGCVEANSSESEPTVTPADAASAFARIPLPRLTSIAQPGEKTLVNFDTIYYTAAEPLTRALTLLGQSVRLQITPSNFRWFFGDGQTLTTKKAGAAYPSKAVTHRYPRRGTVRHHVEVTWTARWSLNGGAFQDVPGSVTTTGPPTALSVVEATPNLSGA
ncbi:MAG: hypothetical protein JWQ74_2901 [Marmoricola sp.]|nr:hypothetical protein [Marmoricola sp.]